MTDRTNDLGDLVGMGAWVDRPCSGGCGARIRAPGGVWCAACLARVTSKERASGDETALAMARESVPDGWQWALHDRPSMAPEVTPELVERVRMPIAGDPFTRGALFSGPAGAGKTSAAVHLLGRFLRSTTRPVEVRATARMVAARDLPSITREAARGGERLGTLRRARLLVLDDIGAEEDTATGRAAVADLIAHLHSWQCAIIGTTFLGEALFRERYGDGIARRMFERASLHELPELA